jgi:hypothetical protein
MVLVFIYIFIYYHISYLKKTPVNILLYHELRIKHRVIKPMVIMLYTDVIRDDSVKS